jgi:hypothetical protein
MAGGAGGGTAQSAMVGSSNVANTVQGQNPFADNGIADAGQAYVDAKNTEANTEKTISESTWNEMSMQDRLNELRKNVEETGVRIRGGEQDILNRMADEEHTRTLILGEKAAINLREAQTRTQVQEALRLQKTMEVMTAQIEQMGKQNGLMQIDAELKAAQESLTQAQTDKLEKELLQISKNMNLTDISLKWAEEQIIQGLNNNKMQALAQFISAIGGLMPSANALGVGKF